jgi:hypothetical protein
VLARPSPAPAAAGLYGWWFRRPPPGVDIGGCAQQDGLTLLYVGISPKAPPTNGREPSRATIRQRLRTHFAGNAAGSTLRLTLGCLLGDELGLRLRRVGSTHRLTFTNPGEQALDHWMAEHAFVSWQVVERAWEAEREILASGLPLPLNLADNPSATRTSVLSEARRRARRAALELPALADSGGPRRG